MDQHIILTLGRSGSNALMDMLNQHPELLNIGEVMGDWTPYRKIRRLFRSEAAYLDFLLSNQSFLRVANAYRSFKKKRAGKLEDVKAFRQIRTVGFKEFSAHFDWRDTPDYLNARPNIKIIGLIREDNFARTLSRAKFRLSNIVSTSEDPSEGAAVRKTRTASEAELEAQSDITEPGKLRLVPELFLEWLEAAEDERNRLEEMLSALPAEQTQVVRYEDLYASEDRRQQIVTDLFRFLGLNPVPTRARMQKIIKTPPNELIENIEECRQAAEATRFARLFEADT